MHKLQQLLFTLYKLECCKKGIQFSGAQIWNSLQPKWKELSFHKFKEAVKGDLILKYN